MFLMIIGLVAAVALFIALGFGQKTETDANGRKTTSRFWSLRPAQLLAVFVLILAIGAGMGAVDLLLARVLCRAFVSNEVVISMGVEAIRIIAFFFVIHAAQMSLSGVLTGAGATKSVMYVSFIGIGVRVLCCYLFGVRTGQWQGLFWATNTFYLVCAALFALYIWKGDWMKYVAVKPRRHEAPASEESEAAKD